MSNRKLYRLLAAVVFLVSLITYLLTMAASVSFWDSGEFIATSYILGIPHSPGTPLYVLVGRVFSMFPLPMTVTQRVNFLSVFFSALAVLMAYLIVIAVIRFMYGAPKSNLGRFVQYGGPMVGAFYLTFSDTYWFDATEAEVYALSAFVMGFCTFLALRWLRSPTGEVDNETRSAIEAEVGKQDLGRVIAEKEMEGRSRSRSLVYLVIYMLALGIGFHLGTILVYAGIFLLLLMVKKKAFSNFELIVFTFGLAVIVADMTLHKQSQLTIVGLVIFAILVIWSTISEGKFALAATGLFVLGISVHLFLYIRSGMNPAIDEVDPETWKSLYAHLRREQYPPIDIFNRKASLLFQFQHFGRYFREQYRMFGDHLLGPLNLGKAAVALPVALGLFGVIANFTRAKKTWVLNFTSLFLNSIGLIIFLNFSDHEVRERDYFYGGAFYFFSIFIGIGATAFLMMMIEGAKEKGRQASYWVVPVGVILLFCSIKPAHYHGFSHDRSRNYIARDYAYNMLVGLEPDAIIFTNGDNDTFPLWYIQCVENFRSDVRVANRSLLNTSWYIKQIRDEDPKVPISLSDGEIDRIRPIPLKGGGVAWKHDLIIQHIIKETNWKRPIYFAVTVPQEVWKPYTDYLEGSGMARRLVPYKGDYMINEYMIARNFDELFMFRGVLTEDGEIDESVYKNSDTRGMFTNFAVAAFQLGQRCGQAKKYKEGISKLELSLKFNPGFDLSKRLIGTYFIRSGEPQKAIEFYNGEIRKNPRAGEFWLMLANAYRSMGQLDAALSNLQEGTKHAPGYRDLYAYGAQVAALLGQREVARDFIERWLNKHPDDKDFKGLFNEIDRYFKQDSSARGTEKKGEK